MTEDSLPCDVVLLPGAALAHKATTLSNELSKYETLFTLEAGVCIPHSSLYMTQLSDVVQAVERLAVIAARTPKRFLTATGYDQTLGFLDAEYQRTEELLALQTAVIAAINPIRAGMRTKDLQRMQEATGLKLSNYQRYGYQAVGDLYRPHLTLTRFTDERAIELEKLPPPQNFDGIFDRIGLFEMGNNGTCIRQIAVFDLI